MLYFIWSRQSNNKSLRMGLEVTALFLNCNICIAAISLQRPSFAFHLQLYPLTELKIAEVSMNDELVVFILGRCKDISRKLLVPSESKLKTIPLSSLRGLCEAQLVQTSLNLFPAEKCF